MPPHWSVPRIRIDSPNSSQCSLSQSSTIDIKDVLRQARLLPKLLAEDFGFGDADNALYFEDGCLQDFPSFPRGRRPPLFVLNTHRARLPFPLRQDAFELGDRYSDEDACPLLTAPTTPRMKLMLKEQVYVQKWVDTLPPDGPPGHIPWGCDMPTTERRWTAEGCIFPVDMVKPNQCSTVQRDHEHACVTGMNRYSALAKPGPDSRELHSLSEAPTIFEASMDSLMSMRYAHTNSADVDSSILRGESKTLCHPCRIVRTSQAPSPATFLPPGSPTGATSGTAEVPLAARRGRSISNLKLNGCVIEHLEYPDIPTAFRGSPIAWSPRFDTFPVPFFTHHESMLLDLKSKCAALGCRLSACTQESSPSQAGLPRASFSVDEWSFTRGLTTFDDSILGSMDNKVGDTVVDRSIFLPDNPSTPVKSPKLTTHLGFIPRLHSRPTSQSLGTLSGGPPGIPLPPRPALVNPSTPPHVRSILKKAKSVRFEDRATRNSKHRTSVPPQERPSTPATVSSERPCTPIANTTKLTLTKGAFGKKVQKKSASKSELPSRRIKTSEKPESAQIAGNGPEFSKQTLVTTSTERLCRTMHAKGNANPAMVPRAQAKQKGLTMTEIDVDVRRGIEGTAKSRLSTPLRNIFRFR